MTILRLILQVRDLEQGNQISLTDFYQKIPFMEVEGMDGETGADKQPPLLCGIIKPEVSQFLVWHPFITSSFTIHSLHQFYQRGLSD